MSDIFRTTGGSNYDALGGRRVFDDTVILDADRQPCIVCGHPTGDCSGDSEPPVHIAGYGDVPSLRDKQTFTVEEDIYYERELIQGLTVKGILHKKGKKITLAEAERLGLWSKS